MSPSEKPLFRGFVSGPEIAISRGAHNVNLKGVDFASISQGYENAYVLFHGHPIRTELRRVEYISMWPSTMLLSIVDLRAITCAGCTGVVWSFCRKFCWIPRADEFQHIDFNTRRRRHDADMGRSTV